MPRHFSVVLGAILTPRQVRYNLVMPKLRQAVEWSLPGPVQPRYVEAPAGSGVVVRESDEHLGIH